MFTLQQSLYIRGNAGDPLPPVWSALSDRGIQMRRGQLVLVCAGPGTGKSALALSYALKARIPTVYFSADSDAFIQLARSVSVISGWPMGKSIERVRQGHLEDVEDELNRIPIRFNYSAAPSLDTVENAMMAYEELYGEFPALVVVDNITNVRTDGADDDPFSGLEVLLEYLHEMARQTESCVIGLHHVTGAYNDGDKPIPLSGIKGQIGRVPEMILTLRKKQDGFNPDLLNVSPVKNRSGRPDPSGHNFASLEFDGETMTIKDVPRT